MNLKNFNYTLLSAIALTVCAMAVPHLLPEKTLTLVPNPRIITFISGTLNAQNANHAQWVDANNHHLRCIVTMDDQPPECNFHLLFNENTLVGADLSNYHGIRLAVKYSGNAKKMRLHIRSYDERFSTPDDSNSTKYHFVNLPTSDLGHELYISLGELKVADWWINQYDHPRQFSNRDLSSSIVLGLDFEGTMPAGEHELLIEKIAVVGHRIAAETWYLGIICLWLTVTGVIACVRLLQLHRRSQEDRQRITELDSSNRNLQSESKKLKVMSTTDALTGALNRHGLNEYLAQRHRDQQRDLAIILLDIDHFKRINDRRGHDEGDRILVAVAQLVRAHVRTQDIFGRWGGEEFILLCPNTSAAKAYALAEKIRVLLSDARFDENKPLIITASFGVGVLQPDEEFSDAFKRVDTALYRAKTLGRNCTVMAEETLEPN